MAVSSSMSPSLLNEVVVTRTVAQYGSEQSRLIIMSPSSSYDGGRVWSLKPCRKMLGSVNHVLNR